jgi:hypothetical protein
VTPVLGGHDVRGVPRQYVLVVCSICSSRKDVHNIASTNLLWRCFSCLLFCSFPPPKPQLPLGLLPLSQSEVYKPGQLLVLVQQTVLLTTEFGPVVSTQDITIWVMIWDVDVVPPTGAGAVVGFNPQRRATSRAASVLVVPSWVV